MNVLKHLSVTMVGPEYPVNLGYTARLLKNFGIERLYLVEPRCDMRVASVYASHGADLLERARKVTLHEVRRAHDLLVATTAIRATRSANVNRSTVTPEEALAHACRSMRTSLVFGRDTTGLRNDELAVCDLVTTIDTKTSYRTLNVSHALAVMLYLASKSGVPKGGSRSNVSGEVLAGYAYELAVASGLQEHRARKLRQVTRRLVVRSNLDKKEFGLLVALMRKGAAAIERERTESQMRSST